MLARLWIEPEQGVNEFLVGDPTIHVPVKLALDMVEVFLADRHFTFLQNLLEVQLIEVASPGAIIRLECATQVLPVFQQLKRSLSLLVCIAV